ncbi:MAG TPA: hypothetical protein VFL41_07735, partial [Gaiellaceae bacterium]|nr:hypothetical protein [Gaiellaceae bacterium]
ENDAAKLWRYYIADRGKETVRYVLAAWAADQGMLDRKETVDRVLAEALERGALDPKAGDGDRDAESYLRMLRGFLRKNGYIRD